LILGWYPFIGIGLSEGGGVRARWLIRGESIALSTRLRIDRLRKKERSKEEPRKKEMCKNDA